MPRIRFKCPSLHSSVISSELIEQAYQRRLLPVREDLLSDDALFNCVGDEERRKTIALEVLTKYMPVLDSDNKPAMDVDISHPTWIREKLMSQLLPEPLLRCASEGGLVPVRPVEACAWFEDDAWSSGSMTYDSGDMCPMVQEMELDEEDLPCKPTTPSKNLSVEPSSPVDSSIGEDFKKSKVQDFEAAPILLPLTLSEEAKLQESIRALDDATPQNNLEADCRLVVMPFETQALDIGIWNFPELPGSQDAELCAIPVVQNPKAKYDSEDPSNDLSCLVDSFGATPSRLDEHAIDLGVAAESPQQRGPCSASVGNILLEDSSIDSSIRLMKSLQIQNMSEKLQNIKNDRLEQSPSSKHRSCDPGAKTTSNSAVFVDLTSADDSSPSCDFKTHDTEENSGIRHQERRLPVGTGASVSTSVLKYEESPYTAANNDNSDHSTLSDEKTTCSTAPPPYFSDFESTRSDNDLSLVNETHACKEVVSQKQSSEANPKDCVLRQNSTRQEETSLALEAIDQQGGFTSGAAPSCEVIPWAITTPTSPASTSPLEHLKIEELNTEKCSGSRDVKMMKKQPLVIVVVNVMQRDGPILPHRRSSYQRILALENEQLQVVERERRLPVDLILSPSTCLIVYTAATMKLDWERNPSLAKKECSAFIVDVIANCQMKAMSFSFEKCFMVFEGESAFTSFILQATQTLAVAAAGFGIQVQCFVSGSEQCTEGIALKCIERIRKHAKRPYPSLMTECENDDELFLEQFPSLNPLAAHAILCLNVPLSKFMLWSHDAMADALQGFEVPTESLRLLKLQSEHRKLKERRGPTSTMRREETYPDNFPSLPSASSGFGDFEIALNDGPGRSDHGNSSSPSLDRIFEIGPLGDIPTNDEHIDFSPPSGPAFQLDLIFDEQFTSERCFNFWDDHFQLSEQEYLPVESWPEETPTQRPPTQRNSNRSQKPEYIQTCLDEWIEKMKRDNIDTNRTKQEFECEFLTLAKASIPSQNCQQDLFPTLNFESQGREKVRSAAINITPAKRVASALDLYRHQKGISPSPHKKLRPLSRPHRRSAVVDISSVQAAQAHLSKRFSFKPVTNPSRSSRSS